MQNHGMNRLPVPPAQPTPRTSRTRRTVLKAAATSAPTLSLAAALSMTVSSARGADRSAPASSRPLAASGAIRAVPDRTELRIETGVHAAAIRRVAVSPDGLRLATASDDKTARIWNLVDRTPLGIVRPRLGAGDTGRLYGVAIHPHEDLVAFGGSTTSARAGEHWILLHRLSDSTLIATIDARGRDIKKLVWSADGSLLFASYAADPAVRAFDLQGTLRHETRLAGPAYGMAVSRDGRVAVASFEGGVLLLQAGAGQVVERARLATADRQPASVAFSPDGNRLVVGFNSIGVAPEVLDVAAGRALARLELPRLVQGNQMTVGWSADGSRIAVGGSGHQREPSAIHPGVLAFPVFLHDAASLRLVNQLEVASDSILDLAPISGKRFAFGAFDGSWGVIEGDRLGIVVESSIPYSRDRAALRVSGNGQRVAWTIASDQDPVVFDFPKRTFRRGTPDSSLKAAATTAHVGAQPGGERSTPPTGSGNVWRDVNVVILGGTRMVLEPGEVSRALSVIPNDSDALLATSRHLMRITADAQIRWRVQLAVEARAVVVAGNGQVVVTGMADGTLRWSRTSDGETLLSLLAIGDGRWVAWTPAGYFDSSTGADRMIGWTVNRDDMAIADFHSVSRFREQFNRPAEIDEVLRRLALSSSDSRTGTAPSASAPAAQAPSAALAETPVKAPKAFPPVLELGDGTAARREGATWQVPFKLRNADARTALELRIDGRPSSYASLKLGSASDGSRHGTVSITAPTAGSLVQLLARNAQGVSEPLTIAEPPADTRIETPPATQQTPARQQAIEQKSARPKATPPDLPAQAGVVGATLPRLFVLSIGISKYQRPEYQLGLAAKDALDFAGQFDHQFSRQKSTLYSAVTTRKLTDRAANRQAVLDGLDWLSSSVTPADVGIVFIAGHGVNAKDGVYYFLPWEADLRRLAQTAIPESALRSTLGKMRGKALLFVDTCFGGEALSAAGSSELARVANDLSSEENGVIVFASSSSRQLSEENDAWGNGAFTKAVLAGLAGKADFNRSGRVTVKGLDYYVSEEVARLTEGRQTPVSISPRGVADFAIARSGGI